MLRNNYITSESEQEITERVWKASGMVKTMCAMPNNVAYIMLYNALDKVKKHPRFRFQIKRNFCNASNEYRRYEKNLYSAAQNRMFHVGDLHPDTRKRYGNITDRDYFELWQDMGSTGYHLALPHLQALTHKFRLSLRKHNVPEADIICHLLTAQSVIDIALTFHRSAMQLCEQDFKVPKQFIPLLYDQFSLARVATAWERAVVSLSPEHYPLTDMEVKNVMLSVRDISDTFAKQDNMLQAVMESVERNEELFRTKGEMKKVLRICIEELEE